MLLITLDTYEDVSTLEQKMPLAPKPLDISSSLKLKPVQPMQGIQKAYSYLDPDIIYLISPSWLDCCNYVRQVDTVVDSGDIGRPISAILVMK